LIDQRPTLGSAGCVGTRTSGAEGGGEQTTARERGMAARLRPYFSILQRKALTPNDLPTLDALAERLLGFAEHYRQIARPFQWTFTRQDLNALLQRIDRPEPQLALAA
jgi:hypothetical protein